MPPTSPRKHRYSLENQFTPLHTLTHTHIQCPHTRSETLTPLPLRTGYAHPPQKSSTPAQTLSNYRCQSTLSLSPDSLALTNHSNDTTARWWFSVYIPAVASPPKLCTRRGDDIVMLETRQIAMHDCCGCREATTWISALVVQNHKNTHTKV